MAKASVAAVNRALIHRLELVVVTLASIALYVALSRYEAINGLGPVGGFLGLMLLLFALYCWGALRITTTEVDPRWAWGALISGTLMFRLALLPAGIPAALGPSDLVDALDRDLAGEAVTYDRFLVYDHDVWRYLWDGHVWAHGENPYAISPGVEAADRFADPDSSLDATGRWVWTDVRANINYPAIPTIYPPLAQIVFRLSHAVAPGSVLAMKLLLLAFELLGIGLLAATLRALGRSAREVAWYAWNPLMIKVFAGSAHMDAIVVAALAATLYFVVRERPALASISVAMAVLAKLSPLIVVPFLLRRTGWKYAWLIAGLIVAGFLPFASVGLGVFDGAGAFAASWVFNAGPFYLIEWVLGLAVRQPAAIARVAAGLIVLVVVGRWYLRDRGEPADFAWYVAASLGLTIVLSPTVMPWYLAWVLPAALIARQRIWFFFSVMVLLAFCILIDERERVFIIAIEYGLFAGFLIREHFARRDHFSGDPRSLRSEIP